MRTIETCRACGSDRLEPVLDLGLQSLSVFSDTSTYRPPRFPLELVYCSGCTLAQLRHTVPPELLFHDSYSFKSGVSDAVRADLRDVVHYALGKQRPVRSWLDIASNDGTLLANVPGGIHTVGIDPLAQFAEEARDCADEIIADFFHPHYFERGQFDVVTSVSMFYDLDDPDGFVAGVATVLADDGVWVIQQNYATSMLQATSVDNISHEHLAYWSLSSLNLLLWRHGLEVNDVQLTPINGGCFRTLVSRRGTRAIRASVPNLEADETRRLSLLTYADFAARARERLDVLGDYVRTLADKGQRVYVYGASTRGAVLWQAAGLDAELEAVVERNPAKIGRWMSAIGAPIISEADMRADPPEYLAIGPWWLLESFKNRERDYLAQGGRMIVPLPELRVIGG